MCILSVYRPTLLKVVGYYDLSVLSMSVMVSTQKKLEWGVGRWFKTYPIFCGIFGIFLYCTYSSLIKEACILKMANVIIFGIYLVQTIGSLR